MCSNPLFCLQYFVDHPRVIVSTRVETAKHMSKYVISLQLSSTRIPSVKTFLKRNANTGILHWLTLNPPVCQEIFAALLW